MYSRYFMLLGSAFLGIGLLFYALFRYAGYLNTPFTGALPTFLHVVAFSLISASLLSTPKRHYGAILFWLMLNLLFELLQYNFHGVFDPMDMAAALLGGVFALLILTLGHHIYPQKYREVHYMRLKLASTLFAGGLLMSGSVYLCYEPVYMSYDTLRTNYPKLSTHDIAKTGKIVLYNNYLYVTEPNVGIHVYDNQDPANPQKKAFIELPGSVDSAIKDGMLYADSFIDLVVIDISTIAEGNITLVSRLEDVFKYNAYQVFEDEYPCLIGKDETKGVIIAYE
ncbi:MAG: hypothetical protein KU28_01455 [Sulfurovum sp. PC08-66]|nr:MAG: hypothetical protein KU28_01455 [Sulfurovum sp. PC08-66]KIM12611.1 MAG: hypothetical protein KU37_01570 [Sulfuricurvum sp. PC08-66]